MNDRAHSKFVGKRTIHKPWPPSQMSIVPIMLAWLLATPAHANAQPLLDVDLPAGSLRNSLMTLADSNGLELVYATELAEGLQAKPLHGEYTLEQALNKLLSGSGIDYRIKSGTTIILSRAPQTRLTTESLMAAAGEFVLADAEPEEKPYTGPVEQVDLTVRGGEWNPYLVPDATIGTKTDTPIMETPLNVQVISKQVLDDQQIISLDQAFKNVSGVTTLLGDTSDISRYGIAQNIVIRGFQSETYFRNGFRLQQGSSMREMANVESVEVLKGPTAVLYGLVEPGGMVNVATKQPLATPYYALQQQFGSYDLYRTTIDATGPLTDDDTLLYRMNLSYENSGSYRDFVSKDNIFLAPVLKWNISDQTRATLELEYNHDNLGLDIPYIPVVNGQFLNFPRSFSYSEPSKGTNDTIFVGFNWSHDFNENWTIKQNFALNQSSNDLSTVAPASLGISPDPEQIPRVLILSDNQDNTYSTSLDLIGHFNTFGLEHTLLLGGDYYRIDNYSHARNSGSVSLIDTFNPIHPGIPPVTFTEPLRRDAINRAKTDQFGLYLQDQIELPYHVFVTGGFRYQYLHQTSDFTNFGRRPRLTPTLTADDVTPRVGVLWQPQSWLSIYGNYAENFGANNTNYVIYPGTAAPPTSSQQWEVGVKTELFGGRLRATLSYFDLTKQNIVTANPDPAYSGFGILTGEVNSRGPELDIQGEILPGWNVIANYSYTDARTTKDSLPPSGYAALPAGSRFWGVPRNTASVWSTYDFQDEVLRGLKIGAGVTLRDSQVIPNTLQPIPGYGVVDLLAAYSLNVGKSKITAQVNVNNLLDKKYLLNATVPGYPMSGFDSGYVNFGQPRSVRGSIKVEF